MTIITLFTWNRYSIFKNKGVLVVLVWSFSILNVFHLLKEYSSVQLKYIPQSISLIMFLVPFLLSPLFGLIADVWWTRYVMLRRLLRLLWLLCIVCILTSLLGSEQNQHIQYARDIILTLTLFVMALCLSGLLVNLIQFGTDQIFDGSSSDIAGLSSWFVWLFHFCSVLASIQSNCISSTYQSLALVATTSLCLTLSLCLDYLCSSCLIKEPTSANPLILIYKVLKFCFKNKYPRFRSAFTYWEDKPYSRIDLGKTKYGGPFTDEQVQDVKTFFQIVFISIVGAILWGFYIVFYAFVPSKIDHLYTISHENKGMAYKCMITTVCREPGYIISLTGVPLYELGLHRFFRRWKILTRLIVGYFIIFWVLVGYLAIESFDYVMSEGRNSTCILLQNYFDNKHRISYFWYMIPNSVLGIGQFFIITATVEFMCAQVPYSMKGLLIGLHYLFLDLGTCLGYVMFLPVTITQKDWIPKVTEGCALWVLLAGNCIILVLFLISSCAFSHYKKRSRDDREFNEHMFAFNYYDHYLRQETKMPQLQ